MGLLERSPVSSAVDSAIPPTRNDIASHRAWACRAESPEGRSRLVDEITTIDCEYLGATEVAAAYLIVDGDRAAFVDNCTNQSVPHMLKVLKDRGLGPENVEYVIITHVHLDHAGGTTGLMKACPNATVLAHPRAAPHVIDPSKLVASASTVYGKERFAELYGAIVPIDASRVRSMEDNSTIQLGNRTLRFIHTRGHANHHHCIIDEASRSVFTGDAFGLHYPFLNKPGTFALPSTSPTDFDGPLARDAVRRIAAEKPSRVFPTHFGPVTEQIDAAADMLVRHLDFHESVMLDAERSDLPDEALTAYCQGRLRDYFRGLLNQHGDLGGDEDTWRFLKLDLDLNGQGLAFVANKRRRKAREAAR